MEDGSSFMQRLQRDFGVLRELLASDSPWRMVSPAPAYAGSPTPTTTTTTAAAAARTSYGVICFRKNPATGEIEYVLVSRRFSIGYHELIEGNSYVLSDLRMLLALVLDTTAVERDMLLHWDFARQKANLWGRRFPAPSESSGSEPPADGPHGLARHKFDYLLRGFWWSLAESSRMSSRPERAGTRRAPDAVPEWSDAAASREFRHFASHRKLVTVQRACARQTYPSGNRVLEPERAVFVTLRRLVEVANADARSHTRFSFPKGRMLRREASPLECALREFSEETNVPRRALEVVRAPAGEGGAAAAPAVSFTEEVVGLNGSLYTYTYFLCRHRPDATLPNGGGPHVSPLNPKQLAEITHAAWVAADRAAEFLSSTLFQRIHARVLGLSEGEGA